MKTLKKTRVAIAVLVPLVLAGSVWAGEARDPAFTITEVNTAASSSFSYGPFAISLGEGSDPVVNSRFFKNDMFTFFGLSPAEYDFGLHFRRMRHCYDILDSAVCDGFWDGGSNRALQWREDTTYSLNQLESAVSNTIYDENTIIYTKVGTGTDGVGYAADTSLSDSSYAYREVHGVAKFNNKTFILKSPVTVSYLNSGYAEALTYTELDDGKILVGGYASFGNHDSDQQDWIYNCYNGDWDSDGDYIYCPAVKMNAAIWLIDPENDADGAEITAVEPSGYLDCSYTDDYLSAGAVNDFVKYNNTIYAVGFSSTDDLDNSINVGATAVYWPITLTKDANSSVTGVAFGSNSEISGLERPGNGDGTNLNTWIVGGNTNGLIVANREMAKSTNSNYATMFCISNLNTSGGTTTVSYPLIDKPFKGANSVALDVNNKGFIVGYRDDRNDSRPVNSGTYRNKEALIYTAADGSSYYLNNFICGKDTNGSAACEQNGKYYFIESATSINDENIILATGYSYPSYNDWQNETNASTATLMLVPADGTVSTDASGNMTLSSDAEVDYPSPETDYADSGRGGAFTPFGLLFLAVAGFFLRSGKVGRRNGCR